MAAVPGENDHPASFFTSKIRIYNRVKKSHMNSILPVQVLQALVTCMLPLRKNGPPWKPRPCVLLAANARPSGYLGHAHVK